MNLSQKNSSPTTAEVSGQWMNVTSFTMKIFNAIQNWNKWWCGGRNATDALFDPGMKGVSVYYLQSIMAKEVSNFRGYNNNNSYNTLVDSTSDADAAAFVHEHVDVTNDKDDDDDDDDGAEDIRTSSTCNKSSTYSSTEKSIYQLENLHQEPGLIRRKGMDVKCPRDGKLGAAYVDCLKGEDHVGQANVMLSYSWGNTFTEILDVVSFYCEKTQSDPKRTYVWICCLCNNQHRVVDNLQNGTTVDFTEFESTFRNKVLGIGNVLALLGPWDAPKYLTRVWCIFELFTANKVSDDLCTLHIDMPQSARTKLQDFLFCADDSDFVRTKFHQVLGNTAIQNAQASVPSDKDNIMRLVNGENGGYVELNNDVNDLLRDWFHNLLKDIYDDIKLRFYNSTKPEQRMNHSSFMTSIDLNDADNQRKVKNCLDNLCALFQSNQDLVVALDCANTNYEYCKKYYGEEDVAMSAPLNDLMNIYRANGEFEAAIDYGKKCIAMKEKFYGSQHQQTALSYYNIGRVYSDKRELKTTLEYYNKALAIYEHQLGTNHERTATVYHSIGFVHHKMKENDQALDMYMKASNIKEKISESNNGIKPSLATTYNSIGAIYAKKGNMKKALEFYIKALNIREKILGEDHASTKLSYKNISAMYKKMGDIKKADEYAKKIALK